MHAHPSTLNDQVVQCPSCGLCYKVTQQRQLLSLQKSRHSAISVSPTTRFWCSFWCIISVGCLASKCNVQLFTRIFVTNWKWFTQNDATSSVDIIHPPNFNNNTIQTRILSTFATGGMTFLHTTGNSVTTGSNLEQFHFSSKLQYYFSLNCVLILLAPGADLRTAIFLLTLGAHHECMHFLWHCSLNFTLHDLLSISLPARRMDRMCSCKNALSLVDGEIQRSYNQGEGTECFCQDRIHCSMSLSSAW